MRVSKTAYQYLQKAFDLATKDRDKLKSEQERYLQPASVKSAREILQMTEDGFDLIKNIEDIVKLDLALADLKNILWYSNPDKKD